MDRKKLKNGGPWPEIRKESDEQKPFTKANIWLMLGCLGLIVLGFCLMLGPGSTIEGGFNPDIFSTRRIVVGPTLAFLGFALMAFAIMYEPCHRKKAENLEKSDNSVND